MSRNKDERLCKEHESEGVSSLILDFEAVRMNADGLHLSRLSKGHMESLNRIAKELKKNELSSFFCILLAAVLTTAAVGREN